MNRLTIVCLSAALSLVACGSDNPPPTAPTRPTTTTTTVPPTVVLQSVALSSSANTLQAPGQTASVVATGTFSNGTTQNITANCVGWTADNTFVLTVSGNGVVTARNSGQSTVTTSCQGIGASLLITLNLAPPFVRTGVGPNVFNLPSYVTRIRVIGDYAGFCENFIVHLSGRSLVNEILGSCSVATTGRHFDGTFAVATAGALVEVLNASSISWSVTEVR